MTTATERAIRAKDGVPALYPGDHRTRVELASVRQAVQEGIRSPDHVAFLRALTEKSLTSKPLSP